MAPHADRPPRPPHEVPYFDDLRVGEVVDGAPAVTLTAGHAALHGAIVGDRLRVALDADLAASVVGGPGVVAHPGLVCDVAIGQTTALTQRVVGNLFYRGLLLARPVVLGDTLRTTTTIEALRPNRARDGRAPTGLAVLRVRTVDQHDRPVLDFRRCAMLPARSVLADPPAGSSVADGTAERLDPGALRAAARAWDLGAFRRALPSATSWAGLRRGQRLPVTGGDVVTAAPELARLTLNVATVHHDATASSGGRRLVYGGHTIGLAGSQLTRVLPDLVTILGWERCDHLGPVHEGDTLHSTVEVEDVVPMDGGALVALRSRVRAVAPDDGPVREVLDWRLVGLHA